MKSKWRFVAVAMILCAPSAGSAQGAMAFVNATVVDVERGVLVPRQSIVIRNGRIAQVGPTATTPVPPGASRVDLQGRYVLPGLWDMHVHVAGAPADDLGDRMRYFGSLFLANGVTGVRDLGGYGQKLKAMNEIGTNQPAVMPRLVYSGDKIGPADGDESGMFSLQDLKSAIAARRMDGATFVKLTPEYPASLFPATLAECAATAARCVAHVPPADTSIWLTRARGWSYEHLFNLSEHVSRVPATTLFAETVEYNRPTFLQRVLYKLRLRTRPQEPEPARVAARDTSRDEAFFRAVARSGAWFTPTLLLHDHIARVATLPEAATDSLLALAPQPPLKRTPERMRSASETWQLWTGLVRSMSKAGVPMLAGTDFGGRHVPGASLHAELVLLQQAGMPPAAVLRAATINPALYLGAADTLGSVNPGRVADLVVLRENPLEDVARVSTIDMVVTRGHLLRRADLDRLTSAARVARSGLRAPTSTANDATAAR